MVSLPNKMTTNTVAGTTLTPDAKSDGGKQDSGLQSADVMLGLNSGNSAQSSDLTVQSMTANETDYDTVASPTSEQMQAEAENFINWIEAMAGGLDEVGNIIDYNSAPVNNKADVPNVVKNEIIASLKFETDPEDVDALVSLLDAAILEDATSQVFSQAIFAKLEKNLPDFMKTRLQNMQTELSNIREFLVVLKNVTSSLANFDASLDPDIAAKAVGNDVLKRLAPYIFDTGYQPYTDPRVLLSSFLPDSNLPNRVNTAIVILLLQLLYFKFSTGSGAVAKLSFAHQGNLDKFATSPALSDTSKKPTGGQPFSAKKLSFDLRRLSLRTNPLLELDTDALFYDFLDQVVGDQEILLDKLGPVRRAALFTSLFVNELNLSVGLGKISGDLNDPFAKEFRPDQYGFFDRILGVRGLADCRAETNVRGSISDYLVVSKTGSRFVDTDAVGVAILDTSYFSEDLKRKNALEFANSIRTAPAQNDLSVLEQSTKNLESTLDAFAAKYKTMVNNQVAKPANAMAEIYETIGKTFAGGDTGRAQLVTLATLANAEKGGKAVGAPPYLKAFKGELLYLLVAKVARGLLNQTVDLKNSVGTSQSEVTIDGKTTQIKVTIPIDSSITPALSGFPTFSAKPNKYIKLVDIATMRRLELAVGLLLDLGIPLQEGSGDYVGNIASSSLRYVEKEKEGDSRFFAEISMGSFVGANSILNSMANAIVAMLKKARNADGDFTNNAGLTIHSGLNGAQLCGLYFEAVCNTASVFIGNKLGFGRTAPEEPADKQDVALTDIFQPLAWLGILDFTKRTMTMGVFTDGYIKNWPNTIDKIRQEFELTRLRVVHYDLDSSYAARIPQVAARIAGNLRAGNFSKFAKAHPSKPGKQVINGTSVLMNSAMAGDISITPATIQQVCEDLIFDQNVNSNAVALLESMIKTAGKSMQPIISTGNEFKAPVADQGDDIKNLLNFIQDLTYLNFFKTANVFSYEKASIRLRAFELALKQPSYRLPRLSKAEQRLCRLVLRDVLNKGTIHAGVSAKICLLCSARKGYIQTNLIEGLQRVESLTVAERVKNPLVYEVYQEDFITDVEYEKFKRNFFYLPIFSSLPPEKQAESSFEVASNANTLIQAMDTIMLIDGTHAQSNSAVDTQTLHNEIISFFTQKFLNLVTPLDCDPEVGTLELAARRSPSSKQFARLVATAAGLQENFFDSIFIEVNGMIKIDRHKMKELKMTTALGDMFFDLFSSMIFFDGVVADRIIGLKLSSKPSDRTFALWIDQTGDFLQTKNGKQINPESFPSIATFSNYTNLKMQG